MPGPGHPPDHLVDVVPPGHIEAEHAAATGHGRCPAVPLPGEAVLVELDPEAVEDVGGMRPRRLGHPAEKPVELHAAGQIADDQIDLSRARRAHMTEPTVPTRGAPTEIARAIPAGVSTLDGYARSDGRARRRTPI